MSQARKARVPQSQTEPTQLLSAEVVSTVMVIATAVMQTPVRIRRTIVHTYPMLPRVTWMDVVMVRVNAESGWTVQSASLRLVLVRLCTMPTSAMAQEPVMLRERPLVHPTRVVLRETDALVHVATMTTVAPETTAPVVRVCRRSSTDPVVPQIRSASTRIA